MHEPAKQRHDAVKLVIGALLADEERRTCDRFVNGAATSYKDFGMGLRFHNMQEESLTALRRAQEEMPWNFHINYQTAFQELRCGRCEDAKSSALRAWGQINQFLGKRRDHPEHVLRRKVEIARLLGDIFSALGDSDAAAFWWKKTIRSAPNKADAVVDAGRRLIRSGNTDLAKEVLSQEPELAETDARISSELEVINKLQTSHDSRSPQDGALQRRIVILLDLANVEGRRREGRLSLDYASMVGRIADGAEVVAADAFIPDIPEMMNDLGEHLKRLGFTVRPIRARWQGTELKADADAAIGAWMIVRIGQLRPDEVWLVTSDEDFAQVMEPAHELLSDVKVCFAGINQNGHSELALRGDRWLPLQERLLTPTSALKPVLESAQGRGEL
jgi:tetratricopeptide (TPR) repeat protein